MLELAVVAFAGLAFVLAFFALKVAYQMGAKHAAAHITDFFRREIASDGNDLKSIPGLLARHSFRAARSFDLIARKLYFAALNDGMALQARVGGPKDDESSVTMKTAELDEVAWLADSGLLLWISSDDEPLRDGERLTYEKAETLASLLNKFERRIVPDLLAESESDRERRFTTDENRMVRVWTEYGKL